MKLLNRITDKRSSKKMGRVGGQGHREGLALNIYRETFFFEIVGKEVGKGMDIHKLKN